MSGDYEDGYDTGYTEGVRETEEKYGVTSRDLTTVDRLRSRLEHIRELYTGPALRGLLINGLEDVLEIKVVKD